MLLECAIDVCLRNLRSTCAKGRLAATGLQARPGSASRGAARPVPLPGHGESGTSASALEAAPARYGVDHPFSVILTGSQLDVGAPS